MLTLGVAQDVANAVEDRARYGAAALAVARAQSSDADTLQTQGDAIGSALRTQDRAGAQADYVWSSTVWSQWKDATVARTAADVTRVNATADAEAQAKRDIAHATTVASIDVGNSSKPGGGTRYTPADQGGCPGG